MHRILLTLVLFVFAFTAGTSARGGGDVPVYGGFSSRQALDVSDQYFIVFKSPPGDAERSMVLSHGAAILHSYTIIPAYAVRVPGAAALDAISADPRVDFVDPVQVYHALGSEGSPEISDPSGDQSAAGNATQDILKAWVDQPDGAHLRFTIKVRDLTGVNPSTGDGLPVNGVWRYSFTLKRAGTTVADVYFVTLRRPETGPLEFSWGFVDATGVNSTQGDADQGEIVPADGIIRIIASNGLFAGAPNGNSNPGPGDVLTVPFAQAVQLVGVLGTGLLANIDRAPNTGGGANFTLQTIVAPVSVDPASLDFGLMNPGQTAVLSVTLTNNGAGTLTVSSASSTEPEFSVSPLSASIAPSSSHNFSVTFAPVSPGSKNGQIVFTHNAAGSPATVAVSGAAAAPSQPETHPWGIDAVRAPQVWNTTKGQGIKIGILDTGIDSLHYELDARYKGGYNFVSNNPYPVDGHSHGTHVAGTIGAELNGIGVVGVAPEVDIYALKVLSDAGSGSSAGILAAIDWCVQNGMNIASMSLGGGIPIDGPTGPVGRVPVYSPTEELAYQNAYDAGLLIIVASGNDGEPVVMYPAAYQAPMSVGAVDRTLTRASFSNFGADLEIVGPGVDVKSTVPRGMGRNSAVVHGPDNYEANSLEFAALTTTAGISATAIDCGKGLTPADFPAAVAGNIALIQRGDSSFATKVMNAQSAGAVAAIIYNNVAGNFNGTLGTARDDVHNRDWIPGVSLSMEDGMALAAQTPTDIAAVNSVDDFNRFSGTSMATPHVSAVAALAWSVNPSLTNEQVREILKASATDLGVPGFDPEYGQGLANAEAAVAMASGATGGAKAGTISPTHPTVTWTSGPFTGTAGDPLAADCSNSQCDIFTLTVEGTNPNAHDVTIRLDWTLSSNDFDLRILDSAGAQVGASGHGTTNYEQASFAAIPGVYSVIVTVFAAVNESYIGTATLIDIPDPPTTFRNGRYENFDFGFTPDLQLPEQERSLLFVNQDIEPEIEIDRFGTIYIGAIRGVPGGVDFWRSDDAGASFQFLGQPDGAQNPNPAGGEGGAGGGDVDIAMGDPFYVVPPTPLSAGIQSTGRIYVTSLWLGSSSLAVSTDRGDNWTFNPFTTAQHDRQWNVARGEKTLYMSMRKLAQIQVTQQHSVYVVQSDDGALFTRGSFVEHPETGVQENVGGNIVLTSNGTLVGSYTSYDGRDLYVYRSPKEGGTPPADLPPGQTEVPVFAPDVFETGRVFHSPPGVNTNSKFPIMAVDQGDNLHIAFADRKNIYLISCPAGLNPTVAANWTRPLILNAPRVAGFEYTRTTIFPWIHGGAAGTVACLWYGTDAAGDPDTPEFETSQVPWRIIYAQVENALSDTPNVYLDIASNQGGGVIHTGQICNRGTGCPDDTRELAEYSSLTVDNQGFANIAYAGTIINGSNPSSTGAITFFTKSTKRPLVPAPIITKVGGCDDSTVNRKGGWHRVNDDRATDAEYCRIVGAAPQAFLEFAFNGTRVDMQMARGPRGGNAQVWIDGVSRGGVDFWRAPSDPSKPDNSGKKDLTFGEFVSYEMEPGDHVFRIDILNDKPEPLRDMIYVDGFVIEQGQTAGGNAVFTENVQVIDAVAAPASVSGTTVMATPGTTLLTGVVEVADGATVNFLLVDPLGAVTAAAGEAPTRAVATVPNATGAFTFQVVNTGLDPVPYRLYAVSSASGAAKAGLRTLHETPSAYRLEQNYPNPFNPRTTISYDIPDESYARLTLFNVYGQEVATIVDRKHQAGKYSVVFDAGNLASGVYFYKLVAGTFTGVKRLVLMK